MLQQKKMFKVISAVQKVGGTGAYWTRIGTGWLNRDNSINLKLDYMPKSFELQIREFDEDELRKRDPADTTIPFAPRGAPELAAAAAKAPVSSHANDLPF